MAACASGGVQDVNVVAGRLTREKGCDTGRMRFGAARRDASNYQAWASQPVGTAGGIALVWSVVGLMIWFLSRRYGRVLAVAGVGP
jgi:hypothetical protein